MIISVEKNKENTILPAIARASIHLFVLKGIDGTTIKDIAKKADVAEGALYRHFKSKEELAWHLFSTHVTQFTMELMEKVLIAPTAEARIRIYTTECFAAFESNHDLFTFLILNEHRELQKFPQSYLHPGRLAVRIIEEGQKEGSIAPGDPMMLGSLFAGAIIRCCIARNYGRITTPLTDETDRIVSHLWTMLKKSES